MTPTDPSPTPSPGPSIIELINTLTPILHELSMDEADPLKRLVIDHIIRARSTPMEYSLADQVPFLKNLRWLSDLFCRFEWIEDVWISELRRKCIDDITEHSLIGKSSHTLQECRILLEFLGFLRVSKTMPLSYIDTHKDAIISEVVAKVEESKLEGMAPEEPFGGLRELVTIRKILLMNGWSRKEISVSVQRHAGTSFFPHSVLIRSSCICAPPAEPQILTSIYNRRHQNRHQAQAPYSRDVSSPTSFYQHPAQTINLFPSPLRAQAIAQERTQNRIHLSPYHPSPNRNRNRIDLPPHHHHHDYNHNHHHHNRQPPKPPPHPLRRPRRPPLLPAARPQTRRARRLARQSPRAPGSDRPRSGEKGATGVCGGDEAVDAEGAGGEGGGA